MKTQLQTLEECIGKVIQSTYEGLECVILDFGDAYTIIGGDEGCGVIEYKDWYLDDLIKSGVASPEDKAKYEAEQAEEYERVAKSERQNTYNRLRDELTALKQSNFYGEAGLLEGEELELAMQNEIDKVQQRLAPLDAEFGTVNT